MKQNPARITAIASYLPRQVLTNHDLEKMVDTSDEWIISRTGIKERRIARPDEGSAAMGYQAALQIMEKQGISSDSIEAVIVGTMTPDYITPSTAALIQARLGATKAAAFDYQAACTGFIYGLSIAKAYIESGIYKRILLITSEKMSSFIDYTDRNTCVLFGDGAAALLIEGEGKGLLIDSVCLGADGSEPEIAWIPAGGSLKPPTHETVEARQHFFQMKGKEIFKQAVRKMSLAAQECLEKSGMKESNIQWIVPHQANARILDALAKNFSIEPEKVHRTLDRYGNTSASSAAIALDDLLQKHSIKTGEVILTIAFGAGLTWGAAILKQN